MKLASLRRGGADGTLVLVDRCLQRARRVPEIAATLREALEDWDACGAQLEAAYAAAVDDAWSDGFDFDLSELASPLPRAFQFLDGSVYLSHMEKARKARGAEMPPDVDKAPLMYQGLSDRFWPPLGEVPFTDDALGIDLEAEIAVVVDEVPMGTPASEAGQYIRLVMLLNDWSLRALTRVEVPLGFGFVQSKPPSACSPVAVTVDELDAAWDGRKLSGALLSFVNDEQIGQPDAGSDMAFDYPQLIAHAARTRTLGAGTIIGAGTVSNRAPGAGHGCLAERRMDEQINEGEARTPFLRFGDRVRIDMLDADGLSIFGAIEQTVVRG